MKITKFVTVAICVVVLLVPQSAVVATSPSPLAGGYTQMCYDSQSGLIVLYGGQKTGDYTDPANYLHETWTFNPLARVWTQMLPTLNPGGTSGGFMTYDSKRDLCILSIISDDWSELQTWAYDLNTNTWTQRASGPRAMVGQRIVYDSKADRIIMFGGFGSPWTMGQGIVDETWAYDYDSNTWTNMRPRVHPTGRNYFGMTYDSEAGRVVLWGDWTRNYNPSIDTSVWTYDYSTNTWQEFPHKWDGPAGRDYVELVYDERADKIIMYGGYSYGNDETWVYDLESDTWRQKYPASNPGALSRYSMVYVKDLNATVLYGGQEGPTYDIYKTDVWSYRLKFNTWTNITPAP